jgi:hypothetical protein
MPTTRETSLQALLALPQTQAAPVLHGEVLLERAPAAVLLILRDGDLGRTCGGPLAAPIPLSALHQGRGGGAGGRG